jgi:L-galactose dehydrogenase
VTVLGLGGGFLDHRSYADGVATVRRALERGITYFDTSPLYGRGVSQRILGEALEGRKEPYTLATKLGHFPAHGHFRDADALRAQIDDNLRLLRRDAVDVLQVHEADWHCWWSDDAPHEGALRAEAAYDFAQAPVLRVLREARERGRCRFIGITGNGADNMARVLRGVDVDTFLVAFNYDLIGRAIRREALPAARSKGVATILGGVFQNGRLATVYREWLTEPPPWMSKTYQERLARLYTIQEECGLSLVELTLRYLLADERITVILAGASTPAEVDISVEAAQRGPLPADLHQAIEALGIP